MTTDRALLRRLIITVNVPKSTGIITKFEDEELGFRSEGSGIGDAGGLQVSLGLAGNLFFSA